MQPSGDYVKCGKELHRKAIKSVEFKSLKRAPRSNEKFVEEDMYVLIFSYPSSF